MATIKDVAERAGVTISTVSYAISGTRTVSKKTREHIFQVMRELGYRPHAVARALASKRSRILALLFSPLERGLGLTELEFVTCAADAAKELGYHLVLWSSEIHDEAELQHLSSQGLVDGAILMEVQEGDPRVGYLQDLQLPFAMIGRTSDTSDLLSVDIDFQTTLSEAVRHLSEHGHSSIGFVNQSEEVYQSGYGPVVRGHRAFLDAVENHAISGQPVFAHTTPADGYEAAQLLLDTQPDTTAIVIMNDRAIPGVIQLLTERGLQIPRDISIVSVVSSPRVAEMFVPALTSMDVPSEELGRLSVQYLIASLEGRNIDGGHDLVPCQLSVRGSSGVAPSSRNAS